MKCMRVIFILTLAVAVHGSARASQVPAHEYVALKALERAPKEIKDIVQPNLAAYLCGSSGPDIAYTSHYVKLGASSLIGIEVFPPGTEGHGDNPKQPVQSGDLLANMFRLAEERNNDRDRAFALGWLTHYLTDNVIHPLVNMYGGYYVEDSYHHKILEMMECEHVFQTADEKALGRYVLDLGPVFGVNSNVRPDFVNAAHAATFEHGHNAADYKPSTGVQFVKDPNADVLVLDESGRPKPKKPEAGADRAAVTVQNVPAFYLDYAAGAQNVQAASQAMLATHTGGESTFWGRAILGVALKGPPPTPEEYQKLMKPLVIDGLKLEEEAAPDGKGRRGMVVINYTINDFRLMKPFCESWDKEVEVAVQDCVNNFYLWLNNRGKYQPPNLNLNTGSVPYDAAKKWPGKPKIARMWADILIYDSKGGLATILEPDRKTPWKDRSGWVPIPFGDVSEGDKSFNDEIVLMSKWLSLTSIRTDVPPLKEVWGGRAGAAYLKVPFETDNPGPYRAHVWLKFARTEDKKLYGVEANSFAVLGKAPVVEEPKPPPPRPKLIGWPRDFTAKLVTRSTIIKTLPEGRFDGSISVHIDDDGKVSSFFDAHVGYLTGGKQASGTFGGSFVGNLVNRVCATEYTGTVLRTVEGYTETFPGEDFMQKFTVKFTVKPDNTVEGEIRSGARYFEHMTFTYP